MFAKLLFLFKMLDVVSAQDVRFMFALLCTNESEPMVVCGERH